MQSDSSGGEHDRLLVQARQRLQQIEHVVPHTDADGLAAGAIAIRSRKEQADSAVLLRKGETPFGQDPDLPSGSVALLDWGVRDLRRPGIIVDHHVPESALPADIIVITGRTLAANG